MAKGPKNPKRKKGARPTGSSSGGAAASRPVAERAVLIRWERRNIVLISAGLAAVLLGYVLLSRGDITLAPILLVAGYCVLIPLAFIL
jgi:hypothetical protein